MSGNNVGGARRLGVTQSVRHGQSTVELALMTPILALILLAIVVFSGAYGAKMNLESAGGQATRAGALEGQGTSTVNVDSDILKTVINTSGVNPALITKIEIYKAAPDGSIATDSSTGLPLVNTYSGPPPFTACPSSSPAPASCGWLQSTRHTGEPTDSIGVHITYTYRPLISLPGFSSITINDTNVQRLNPTSSDQPCPVPGVPTNVTVTSGPQPSTKDTISWDPIPGALSYNVYAKVNGLAYTLLTTSNTLVGGRWQTTYDRSADPAFSGSNLKYAPTDYQVAGVNGCVPPEGEHSLPVGNGQCPLPSTPLNFSAVESATPGYHDLKWDPESDNTGVYGQYYIRQQVNGVYTTNPDPLIINGPTTHVTIPYASVDSSYLPVKYTLWYKSSCGVDGSGTASTFTVSPVAPPALSLTDSDGKTYVKAGDTLTYTLNFSNGPSPSSGTANHVSLTDTLDPNVTYDGTTPCAVSGVAGSCTYSSGVVTVNLTNSLAPGASGTVHITAKVNAGATGALANTVTMANTDANNNHPQTTTASDSPSDTVIAEPVLTVSNDDSVSSVKQGGTLTYKITFHNTATQSGATAQNVAFTDQLPSTGALAGKVTPNGASPCSVISGSYSITSCTWDGTSQLAITLAGTVAPGASGTIAVSVKVASGASVGSTVTNAVNMTYQDLAGTDQTPHPYAVDAPADTVTP